MADHIELGSSAPVAELDSPESPWWSATRIKRDGLLISIDWTIAASLALLFIVGLGLRLSNLGAVGFAEDEINKVEAIQAYERGDITANSEHPMLMKGLMFVTTHMAPWVAVSGAPISEEAALRFPNALFGALTIIPLFFLTAAFFDRWTGLAAAAFWAFGVNAITYNRIGKEDTLLVFFILLGFFFYLRAKQTSPRDVLRRKKHYILGGCSFGLMMASKYFPHYFGLNALYHHNFHVRQKTAGEPSGKTPIIFYIVLTCAFLIANPAVLLPQVWNYLSAYMGERLLVHTGYFFGGQLYRNNMSRSPFWGTPIYFYLLFMAIKIPATVLIAFVIGLFVSIRNWRHPGHAFILFMLFFWIVPYSLAGAKWLRYTLSLMPFVYMLAAVGVVSAVRFLQVRTESLLAAAVVVLFLGLPALAAYNSGPHYSLYTNVLGAGRAGYFFPHDEFYDDGLREAIKFVCETAPTNAIIAHETPGVARYYLQRFARTDLDSQAISTPEFDPSKLVGPAYVIVQRGRIYFQNQNKLEYVERNFVKVHEVKVNGLTAAEVYAQK